MSTQYLVGPSKTYTTIGAAVSAIPANISGTGVHEIIVDAGTYALGSGTLDITKAGESAADYIILRAATGSEHRGIVGSGVLITKGSSSSRALKVDTDYTIVQDIEVLELDTFTGNDLFNITAINCVLVHCIVRSYGSSGFKGGNLCSFYKCIAIQTSPLTNLQGFDLTTNNCTLRNCVGYGFTYCFSGSNATVFNCWGFKLNAGASPKDFNGTYGGTSSNNASSDTSAPGANSLKSLTPRQFGLIDKNGFNFHVNRFSSLIGAGVSQSAAFTTDIDGDTIVTWPIGIDYDLGTTFCYSDYYNYVLSTTSTPLFSSLGNPFITNNHLIVTYNDIVKHDTFYGTRGWAVTYTLKLNTAYDSFHFNNWIEYNQATYTGGFPSFTLNSSKHLILSGRKFTDTVNKAFGNWNLTDAGLVADSNTSITVRFVYKQGTQEAAATATLNGITYSSGWVSIPSGINDYYLMALGINDSLGGDPGAVEFAGVYSLVWRNDISDLQADAFYAGEPICGDLIHTVLATSTSSSPWEGEHEPHERIADAKTAAIRTKQGDTSPPKSKSSDTHEANEFSPRTQPSEASPTDNRTASGREAEGYTFDSKKGKRTGFISIMPELNGYAASSPGLGTGYLMSFMGESLAVGKEFRDLDVVGRSRANNQRRPMYNVPQGKIDMAIRSNTLIPILQSHFQRRIGTTPATGTTYYEFVPSKGRIDLAGSQFGTGSYLSNGTANALSLSVYKDFAGNGQLFKSGVADKLTFKLHALVEPSLEAEFKFREGTLMGTQTTHPYGTYSSLPEFSPSNCSVNFLGIPVLDLEFTSDNSIENRFLTGDNRPWHKFGQYKLGGKATLDLSKDRLGVFGSVINGSAFSVSATMYNANHDRIVFEFPDCRLSDFPIGFSDIYSVPFKAYASDDGSTAPIKVRVWTQNYSATTFQPN